MIAVITGGSGSGKSEFAEELAMKITGGKKTYIATMYPYDDETKKKIKRHQDMRKEKNFVTKECYTGLKELKIDNKKVVLLECMSNLVSNEMYMGIGSEDKEVNNVQAAKEIIMGLRHLKEEAENVIIVTNEVFSDGRLYDESMRGYLKILADVNAELAYMADMVIEIVYSIPVFIKGREVYNAI